MNRKSDEDIYRTTGFRVTAHLISVRGDHLTESDWCWCQPTLLDIPPNGQIILHRRTMDGPE